MLCSGLNTGTMSGLTGDIFSQRRRGHTWVAVGHDFSMGVASLTEYFTHRHTPPARPSSHYPHLMLLLIMASDFYYYVHPPK